MLFLSIAFLYFEKQRTCYMFPKNYLLFLDFIIISRRLIKSRLCGISEWTRGGIKKTFAEPSMKSNLFPFIWVNISITQVWQLYFQGGKKIWLISTEIEISYIPVSWVFSCNNCFLKELREIHPVNRMIRVLTVFSPDVNLLHSYGSNDCLLNFFSCIKDILFP